MTHLISSARFIHLVDAALAVWVAAWIGLGVGIAIKTSDLTTLSRTVAEDGRAVESVGHSLNTLQALPLVGGTVGKDAQQVEQAGANTAATGTSSISSIQTLSVLLGVAVALLPSVPVFGFYVPARLEREREARALRRTLRVHGTDPEFEGFLARRAIVTLGYHRLRRVSETPWADIQAGHCSRLAAAELDRLGIDPKLLGPAGRVRS